MIFYKHYSFQPNDIFYCLSLVLNGDREKVEKTSRLHKIVKIELVTQFEL
jgi:hypothetical protein